MGQYNFLILLIIFCLPAHVYAAITFDANGKWETTFDCPSEWENGDGSITCSGWEFNRFLDTACNGGTGSKNAQVVTAAEYSEGGGGMGFRQWAGNVKNNISGGIHIVFPTNITDEFWMRWYQRADSGLASGLAQGETKTLHVKCGDGYQNAFAFGLIASDQWRFWLQNPATGPINSSTGYGWNSLVSQNNWEAVEMYIKADTDGTDGIIRTWVNGVLVLENESLDTYPTGGWTGVQFTGNHEIFTNTDCAPFDYDDVVIYNQTPPNVDADGNAFIGLMAGGAVQQFSGAGSVLQSAGAGVVLQ